MATSAIQVYKNEDVNNPEYATIEEVQQAFFGRGVFIKGKDGTYSQATGFNPLYESLYAGDKTYRFSQP